MDWLHAVLVNLEHGKASVLTLQPRTSILHD
jgi:hypothetical protein